jgi:REP element-mobilizing transposase RayT
MIVHIQKREGTRVGTHAARVPSPLGDKIVMSVHLNETKSWHSRGYLPHFDDGVRPQFITFRLADSLPISFIEKAKSKLDRGIITEIEYHKELDKWLDKGIGEPHLRDPRIAGMVAENLRQFAGNRYELHAWVIMPNHVHLLLSPINGISLAKIMHGIKSYTSHRANEILFRKGHFWSKEYFDRYIRDGRHFSRTVDYINNNPVKAGLCETPAEWPFGSASGVK